LRRRPTAVNETDSEEPPKLTNGRGMPVVGRVSVTAAMLTKAWKISQVVIPVASSNPKVSGARSAAR
jgi:hypothetical protein